MNQEQRTITDKELRRLSHAELLEMLLASAREKEALKNAGEELKKQCEDAKHETEDMEMHMRVARDQEQEALKRLAELQEVEKALREELRAADEALEAAKRAADIAAGDHREAEERADELEKKLAASEAEKEELKRQLDARVIMTEKAGTLADAAVQINGVLEAAQRAADQYLENIELWRTREEERRDAIMAEGKIKAEQMIREAEQRCALMEEQTRRRCEALKNSAEKNVWEKWSNLSEQLQQISEEIRSSVGASEKE